MKFEVFVLYNFRGYEGVFNNLVYVNGFLWIIYISLRVFMRFVIILCILSLLFKTKGELEFFFIVFFALGVFLV